MSPRRRETDPVSNPIVFISTHKIKAGKLEGLRQFMAQGEPRIKADKPGTVGFLAYINEAATQVKIVHIFPDGQAMVDHFEGAEERAGNAWEFVELQSFEVFGDAPQPLIQGLEQSAAEMGADLRLAPEFAAGYLRLAAG